MKAFWLIVSLVWVAISLAATLNGDVEMQRHAAIMAMVAYVIHRQERERP